MKDKLKNFMIVSLTEKICNRFTKLTSLTATGLEFLMLHKGKFSQKYTVMTISCHEIIFKFQFRLLPFAFTLVLGDP